MELSRSSAENPVRTASEGGFLIGSTSIENAVFVSAINGSVNVIYLVLVSYAHVIEDFTSPDVLIHVGTAVRCIKLSFDGFN